MRTFSKKVSWLSQFIVSLSNCTSGAWSASLTDCDVQERAKEGGEVITTRRPLEENHLLQALERPRDCLQRREVSQLQPPQERRLVTHPLHHPPTQSYLTSTPIRLCLVIITQILWPWMNWLLSAAPSLPGPSSPAPPPLTALPLHLSLLLAPNSWAARPQVWRRLKIASDVLSICHYMWYYWLLFLCC